MRYISVCYYYAIIILALNLLILPITANAIEDDDEMVVVVRTVKTNYQNPNFDADAFQQVIQNSLPRHISIKPNQTLSDAVKDNLRLWENASPKVYKQVLEYIKNQNTALSDINMIKPGDSVLIPDIPLMAELANPGTNSKKLETSTRVSSNAAWGGVTRAYMAEPFVSDLGTRLGQTERQIRTLPLKIAKQYNLVVGDLSYEEVRDSNQYALASLSMKLTMSAQNGLVPNNFMSQKEADALSKLLANRVPVTRPLLVVLDGVWPDNAEFNKAADFTLKATETIRSKFELPASTSAEIKDLNLLKQAAKSKTNFCSNPADCENPNLRHHSALIKESLKQFESLDKNNLVDVIYLPTGTFQQYSENVLRQMIRVSEIANSVDPPVIRNPRPSNHRTLQAYQNADEAAIKTMFSSPGIDFEPSPFDLTNPNKELTISSNKGVFDGIFNFFWFYSIASERPVYISLSWSTPKVNYPYILRDGGPTVWLAAAGNTADHNIYKDPVDFASRETFLVVQNTSDAGCPTSTFTDSEDLQVYGLIFNGSVTDKVCGTSFSTPRVGWLLAAREAIKGKPLQLNGYQNWSTFRSRNRTFITKLTQSQSGELRYRKSIWEILEEPKP